MSFGARIKEYIKFKRISVRKFEQKSDLKNGAIHKVITNDTSLNGESIASVGINWEDLNLNWLMTGVGEMILEPSSLKDPVSEYSKDLECKADDVYWFKDALKRADEQIALQKDMIATLNEIIESQRSAAKRAGIEL